MTNTARTSILGGALMLIGVAAGRIDVSAQGAAHPAASPAVTLPAVVETAFRKAYPKASMKAVSREGADYEIESVDAGQARDLIYRADGTLVSYEEAIAERDVPAAVTAAVKARFPDMTFTGFEKVVTGTRTSYEIAGKRSGKPLEVELSASGEWLSPKP